MKKIIKKLTPKENFRKILLINYALFCVKSFLNSTGICYFQYIVTFFIEVRQIEKSKETEKEKKKKEKESNFIKS